MRFKVRTNKIIPSQTLRDKVGHLAEVEYIEPCNQYGALRRGTSLEEATHVSIGIKNYHGLSSALSYKISDFRRLARSYDSFSDSNTLRKAALIRKPVVSVYYKNNFLTGIIPLGENSRISF